MSRIPKIFNDKIFYTKNKLKFKMPKISREDIIKYPDDICESLGIDFAFGGYYEKRKFYKSNDEIIHTGIDLFVKEGETLLAPFDGTFLNSFWAGRVNYQVGFGTGTQLITIHTFDQVARRIGQEEAKKIFKDFKYLKLCFLHLDRVKSNRIFSRRVKSIIKKNDEIIEFNSKSNIEFKQGDKIGFVGSRYDNGGWSNHVHLEAFLCNEYEPIDFSSEDLSKEIKMKAAFGIIKDKEDTLNRNLIDPDLIFNFSIWVWKEKELTLDLIKENKTILELKNVNVQIDREKILKNVSFKVNKGEVVSLLGPSGSGKTTILNVITNFVKYNGRVHFRDNYSITDIGYVFQNSVLYENLSVWKNIYLGSKNNKKYIIDTKLKYLREIFKDDQDKIDELNLLDNLKLYIHNSKHAKKEFKRRLKNLRGEDVKIDIKKLITIDINNIVEILGIKDLIHKKPNQISGGQRQRVAIAKAIIKKPVILIMDEALSSLDAKAKVKTRNWIRKIQKEFNLTLLFVTHDQDEAMHISDKIACINNGTIEQLDTPNNIYNNPKTEFVAKFIGEPEINLLIEGYAIRKYIRPHDLRLKRLKNGEFEIINSSKFNFTNLYILKRREKIIRVISDKRYDIGERVYLEWDDKDIKEFKYD
ncbi:MAG: ATP-binding cassette domain-containing protein [Mycoplasma sp.]|nr:ATP-binding cassette domain-containing protein [Mycoplasma sp.]